MQFAHDDTEGRVAAAAAAAAVATEAATAAKTEARAVSETASMQAAQMLVSLVMVQACCVGSLDGGCIVLRHHSGAAIISESSLRCMCGHPATAAVVAAAAASQPL